MMGGEPPFVAPAKYNTRPRFLKAMLVSRHFFCSESPTIPPESGCLGWVNTATSQATMRIKEAQEQLATSDNEGTARLRG
jgi:hypothetical protein